MIVGIGTDIVAIKRISHIYIKYGASFANKILSATEIIEFQSVHSKTAFLAKRFAAKEALAKALGTGIRGFWLSDISIKHDAKGKPDFVYMGNCLRIVNDFGVTHSHLSISDEKKYAQAFVVLEK